MITLLPQFCEIIDRGEFYIACAMGLHRTDIALCTYWIFYSADKGIAPPPIRGYRQITARLSHGYHYLRNRIASFGGLHAWDGFKNGFCALDWTIYPDGRYFADEGGFGMEDNDEEVAYCIIDKNLDIVVPFFYAEDPNEVLNAVRAGTYKYEPIEPINREDVIVDVFPIPTKRDRFDTIFERIYYSIKMRFTRNRIL